MNQYLVALLVCITALADYVNYKYIRLPKTIGLTVITLGLSLLLMLLLSVGQYWVTPVRDFLSSAKFSTVVLDGMLSYLLFASAMQINVTELAPYRNIIAALATVSVLLCCLLIGFTVYYLAGLSGYHIPLLYCLLFGALISPTDAICVLDIMKRTKISPDIRMKITGESLFNDAAGIVLFVLLLQILSGQDQDLTYPKVAWMLIREGIGGIVLGYVLGYITAYFMRRVHRHETCILMTLALVTGGYSIATIIGASGPICMVVAGLLVGTLCRRPNFAEHNVLRLHGFWNLVEDVMNSFLFVLIGLQLLSIRTHVAEIIVGIIVFFIIIVVRAISVSAPLLIIEPIKQFNWRILTIMTWGGMRGGLSVALALTIPEGPGTRVVVSITYVVVVISIIFQGLSLQPMLKFLERK